MTNLTNRNRPSYIINDADQFVTIRLEGKPIATLTRPRVMDRNGKWEMHNTKGELICQFDGFPFRSIVNMALAHAGLWNAE